MTVRTPGGSVGRWLKNNKAETSSADEPLPLLKNLPGIERQAMAAINAAACLKCGSEVFIEVLHSQNCVAHCRCAYRAVAVFANNITARIMRLFMLILVESKFS